MGERTRRPLKTTVTELQFADDAALVSSSREGVERSARVLDQVASEWGLTLSLQKTKLMVTGTWSEEDLQPIVIRGDSIEVVPEFRYLGSIVEMHGEVLKDVEDKIARASRAFGVLCRPVFQDKGLSLKTKKMVYCAVVMGVLLYGAEAWVNKRAATRKLESFNNKCLRRILGMTKAQQRVGRITSAEVRRRFGVEEVIEDVVVAKRLRWAGHVARMDDFRLPKRILFGWLPQRRPAHGTKQRWRDKVWKDLEQFGIDENSWFHKAQDRLYWRAGAKRASLHALRRGRGREELHMAVVLMLLQMPQQLLHLCWCASLVPGHSGGGKTLQDTSARQLGHAFLVRIRQMLFDLSLPLRGRKASPVPGGFLSRFKVQGVCVCVCVCVCLSVCS